MSYPNINNFGLKQNPLLFSPFVQGNQIDIVPVPPLNNIITEEGNNIITEDGKYLIVE